MWEEFVFVGGGLLLALFTIHAAWIIITERVKLNKKIEKEEFRSRLEKIELEKGRHLVSAIRTQSDISRSIARVPNEHVSN